VDQHTIEHRELAPGARVAPTPAWVDAQPYQIPASPNPHFISHGVCVLLDDSQIDLCGAERGWFYRRAEMVTAPAGAERAAQFSVSFDPKFERVEVHGVAVIRDGRRIEHSESALFEVLRRERNMERLQFDGRLTLHLTLPDVRQGDVVETAFTTYGMRKSLGGRHSAFLGLEWAVGIVDVRVRQRRPKQRAIAERSYNNVPEANETEADDIVDRRWRLIERPAFTYESLAPPWELQSAALQLTEWRDWAEAAAVFTPLYEDSGPMPAEIAQEIERIAAAEPTQAGRAAAILRFTQGAVRYLAISIGEGGYTPRSLAELCETRYGDCKDKSKLYVQMARKLGVDACAALVNTRDGYALPDWLPSGQLFDHCIVRVEVDNKVYWLDPTRQLQPSSLDKLTQCHFGWALPLRPDTAALERMAEPDVPHLSDTLEQVTLGAGPNAPVRYEWEHKFRDVRAEGIREQFAREGAVGVFKAYAEDIRRMWPRAQVVTQEVVSDDVANNVITVREVYEIADAWTKGEGSTYKFQTRDIAIRGSLAPLELGDRTHAIYLGQPGRRTRRVDVKTETDHSGGWMRGNRAGDALSWADQMRVVSPNYLVIEQTLVIGALTLPASEAHTYRQVETDLGGNDLIISETVGKDGKFVKRGTMAGDAPSAWDIVRWVLIGLFALFWLVRLLGN
jgi:hypothetical protein